MYTFFHSKRNWVRYDQEFILVYVCSTCYSCPILMKVEFSQQIFEKYSNIKFHENPSSENRVVPCGQIQRGKHSLFAMSRICLKIKENDTDGAYSIQPEMDRWGIHTHTHTYIHIYCVGKTDVTLFRSAFKETCYEFGGWIRLPITGFTNKL
jgi:hypothetical protein